MKRVSFKVAKAIKEAGYPQKGNAHSTYYDEEYKKPFVPFECNRSRDYLASTYLEVWLWLWREKGNPIQVDYSFCGVDEKIKDPEDAIISAIEYLVENKLLK